MSRVIPAIATVPKVLDHGKSSRGAVLHTKDLIACLKTILAGQSGDVGDIGD